MVRLPEPNVCFPEPRAPSLWGHLFAWSCFTDSGPISGRAQQAVVWSGRAASTRETPQITTHALQARAVRLG